MQAGITSAVFYINDDVIGTADFVGFGLAELDPFMMGFGVNTGDFDLRLATDSGSGNSNADVPISLFQAEIGLSDLLGEPNPSGGPGSIEIEIQWKTLEARDSLIEVSGWTILIDDMPTQMSVVVAIAYEKGQIVSLIVETSGSADFVSILVLHGETLSFYLERPPTALIVNLEFPIPETFSTLTEHNVTGGVIFSVFGNQNPLGINAAYPMDFRAESGSMIADLRDIPLALKGHLLFVDIADEERKEVTGSGILVDVKPEGTRRAAPTAALSGIGFTYIKIVSESKIFVISAGDLEAIDSILISQFADSKFEIVGSVDLADLGFVSFTHAGEIVTLVGQGPITKISIDIGNTYSENWLGVRNEQINVELSVVTPGSLMNLQYNSDGKSVVGAFNVLNVAVTLFNSDEGLQAVAAEIIFDAQLNGRVIALDGKVVGSEIERLEFRMNIAAVDDGTYDVDLAWTLADGGHITGNFGSISAGASWNEGDAYDYIRAHLNETEIFEEALTHDTPDSYSATIPKAADGKTLKITLSTLGTDV